MKIDESMIADGIREKIASDVVNSLDEETKVKIISKSVEELIGNYKFQNVLRDEINSVAINDMRQYLKRGDIRERILEEAVKAVELYIQTLHKGLLQVLLKSIDGNKGYDRPDLSEAIKKILGDKFFEE